MSPMLGSTTFNKHTLAVGLGEEIEVVGTYYVVQSDIAAARYGSGGGGGHARRAENSYKGYPVLYAERMRYTSRKEYLELGPRDIEAVKRFASYPNLLGRLVSMVAPQYSGEFYAKLSLLLTSVRAAPKQKGSCYKRPWCNTVFAGDPGTAKTQIAQDSVQLVPGSQVASGQHSTGKGIVAVAERDSSGQPVLRTGIASLASDANLFIDEFQLLHFDDQEQVRSVMDTGAYDFNKMGIRQHIEAPTSFIITANPSEGDWPNPTKMSLDDIIIERPIKDRLDFFWFFRKPYTPEEREKYAEDKKRLAQMHVRRDIYMLYLFLRTYIYYVRNNSQLQELKFTSPFLIDKLTDLWINLANSVPTAIGNRVYDTIFRTASAFARLLLKPAVDDEVVWLTKYYMTKMYAQLGKPIDATPDKRAITYHTICKVIKEHSQKQYWVSQYSPEQTQFADITFKQAAELACKRDGTVRKYLGDNYRSNMNRYAADLRKMLRDRQNEVYAGGKVVITSTNPCAELALKWVPINVEDYTDKNNDKN